MDLLRELLELNESEADLLKKLMPDLLQHSLTMKQLTPLLNVPEFNKWMLDCKKINSKVTFYQPKNSYFVLAVANETKTYSGDTIGQYNIKKRRGTSGNQSIRTEVTLKKLMPDLYKAADIYGE